MKTFQQQPKTPCPFGTHKGHFEIQTIYLAGNISSKVWAKKVILVPWCETGIFKSWQGFGWKVFECSTGRALHGEFQKTQKEACEVALKKLKGVGRERAEQIIQEFLKE